MSSTYTDKNSPLARFPNWNSQFKNFFTNRVPAELSRIAFPIIVLLKDDRTDFARGERLGLPCWTLILAIWVLADVSKYLDILTLEASAILERPPF